MSPATKSAPIMRAAAQAAGAVKGLEVWLDDSTFGIFMDSCPDRWGQMLMKHRETVEARLQGRARRELRPWDFFLGVQNVTRMGALRFSALQSDRQIKQGPPTEFVEGSGLVNQVLAAPALTHLGELQAVALELTRKKFDFVSILLSKVDHSPAASASVVRSWIQRAYGDWLSPVEVPASSVMSNGALAFSTAFDISKWEGGLKTLQRARTPLEDYCRWLDERYTRPEEKK